MKNKNITTKIKDIQEVNPDDLKYDIIDFQKSTIALLNKIDLDIIKLTDRLTK
jgi:hypothetical protein